MILPTRALEKHYRQNSSVIIKESLINRGEGAAPTVGGARPGCRAAAELSRNQLNFITDCALSGLCEIKVSP